MRRKRMCSIVILATLAAAAAATMLLAGCDPFSPMTTMAAGEQPVGAVRLAGLSAPADSIVYVVDISGSGTTASQYMLAAVVNSIKALTPGQSFAVVLFASGGPAVLAPDGQWKLLPATPANVHAASGFLLDSKPSGPPDEGAMRRAVEAALRFEPRPPDVMFLLASRPYNEPELAERIASANSAGRGRRKSDIYAVGYLNPDIEPVLKRIAGQNGGQFRMIHAVDLGR